MYHFRVHCKVLELEQRKCRSQRMRTKLQNSQPCNATYAAFVYNRIRVDVVRVRYSVAVNTVADCQMPSTAAPFVQCGKNADKKKMSTQHFGMYSFSLLGVRQYGNSHVWSVNSQPMSACNFPLSTNTKLYNSHPTFHPSPPSASSYTKLNNTHSNEQYEKSSFLFHLAQPTHLVPFLFLFPFFLGRTMWFSIHERIFKPNIMRLQVPTVGYHSSQPN